MSETTVISIDAMGGDHGPSVVVPGLAIAAEALAGRAVRFLLHGDEDRLAAELARVPSLRAICEVRHAERVVAMDEKPAQALRRGKGTSLWNAIEAIREGQADAAVSAGNTGALMAMSKLILRMAADLDRPAIVAGWPTLRGVSTVLDVGANIECDAERLVDFAIMGEAFHRAVHRVERPTVGLLNVGSEDQKGHEEVREAHRLLRDGGLDIDYRGFVEGDDIGKGAVDVVVTDGFTGNIALKTAEGTAKQIGEYLRAAMSRSLMSKIGYLFARGAFAALKDKMDPRKVNGGVFLGLEGIVIKSHGGTDAVGFASATELGYEMARENLMAKVREMVAATARPSAAPASPQVTAGE